MKPLFIPANLLVVKTLIGWLTILLLLLSGPVPAQVGAVPDRSPGYDLAAYYFPNYHTDDARNEKLYGKGWSEWELVKNAKPRFGGHSQPKVPLWGYTSESDPEVMKMKTDAAYQYGVDVFIYDWYWYDDGPFLERGLEQGFLKVNQNKVKFAIMWANHDWVDLFPRNPDHGEAPLYYRGGITPETFDRMTDYIIKNYFSQSSYWKIDGCPYFSIYELYRFIQGMGGNAQAKAALETFREKTRKAGFPDLHLNAVVWGIQLLPGETELKNPAGMLDYFSFNSSTSYVWVHHAGLDSFPETDYNRVAGKYFDWCDQFRASVRQPYYPNVTVGWDATPRCDQQFPYRNAGYPCMAVLKNNTPENFGKALETAKKLASALPAGERIITINSWNEWTEGSILEPEQEYGFGYLDQIRKVFREQ